jgi:DNA-binding MarR family transcriptional regulator
MAPTMTTLLSGLITSKMRVRIIMRLFANPSCQSYLRELADEFCASPSHIKEELDQLSSSNLLKSKKNGRQILFSANTNHPIFQELHSMVTKALGMDQVLESIIKRLGNLNKAILIDDYAEGKDSGIIDLVLVGDIDKNNLMDLTIKTEKYIGRKIRTLVLSQDEFDNNNKLLQHRPQFLLWQQSHILDAE